ncbi:MAG: PepSY domain-containing protein [Nitrososphaeraceae archaeon]
MKKKLLIGTLGAALVFGGALAVSATNNDDVSKTNKTKVEKTFLSTDEVEKIALKEVAGIVEEIELEKQAGKSVYEVDIEKDNIDYTLHIDAYSGEIYTIDSDNDDDNNHSHNGQNNQNIISQADAIAIAEKAVNGKVVEIEKDEDDGLIKYEVELKTDRGEVKVEIDASTGKVLEVELDD